MVLAVNPNWRVSVSGATLRNAGAFFFTADAVAAFAFWTGGAATLLPSVARGLVPPLRSARACPSRFFSASISSEAAATISGFLADATRFWYKLSARVA